MLNSGFKERAVGAVHPACVNNRTYCRFVGHSGVYHVQYSPRVHRLKPLLTYGNFFATFASSQG